MRKYIYTQHTLGHIALPKITDGKVEMTVPDPEEVAKVTDLNAQHDAAHRARVKNTVMAKTKDVAQKVAAGDYAAKNVRIPQKYKVPVPEVVIDKDVMMSIGNTYDLPEDNADVQNYVTLGYLVEVVASTPAAAEKVLTNTPEIIKANAAVVSAQKTFDQAMKDGDSGAISTAEIALNTAKDALKKLTGAK